MPYGPNDFVVAPGSGVPVPPVPTGNWWDKYPPVFNTPLTPPAGGNWWDADPLVFNSPGPATATAPVTAGGPNWWDKYPLVFNTPSTPVAPAPPVGNEQLVQQARAAGLFVPLEEHQQRLQEQAIQQGQFQPLGPAATAVPVGAPNSAVPGLPVPVGLTSPATPSLPAPSPMEFVQDPNRSYQEKLDYVLSLGEYRTPGQRLADEIERFRQEESDSAYYWMERVPFLGGALNVADNVQTLISANRIKDGEATGIDYTRVGRYLVNEERQGDRSFWGKVFDVATQIPGFATEFALTGGAYSAGRAGGQKLAQEALGELAETAVGRVARQAVGGAVGTATQVVANPQHIAESATRRMIPEFGLERDRQDQLQLTLLDPGDGFLEALPKGFVDTFIELGSERLGGILATGVGKVLDAIPGASRLTALKTGVVNRWFQNNPGSKIGDLLDQVRQQASWHGVLGEVAEERAGEIARGLTGPFLDEGFGVTGQLATGDFGPALEQLAVEGLAFSVPGLVQGAASQAGSQSLEIPPSRQQTAEPLLELPYPKDFLLSPEGMAAFAVEYPSDAARFSLLEQPTRKDLADLLGLDVGNPSFQAEKWSTADRSTLANMFRRLTFLDSFREKFTPPQTLGPETFSPTVSAPTISGPSIPEPQTVPLEPIPPIPQPTLTPPLVGPVVSPSVPTIQPPPVTSELTYIDAIRIAKQLGIKNTGNKAEMIRKVTEALQGPSIPQPGPTSGDIPRSIEDIPPTIPPTTIPETPSIPEPAPAPSQFLEVPKPSVPGQETTIVSPGIDQPIPAQYAVFNLPDLVASHSFMTGQPSSNVSVGLYPQGLQPRDYGAGTNEAAKVSRIAGSQFDPRFLISQAPSADMGPPTVTPSGIVINGNGRVMSLQLLSRRGRFPKYRNELVRQAESFGLDPKAVEGMNAPVLVRVVDVDPTSPQAVQFARSGNISTTESQSPARTAESLRGLVDLDLLDRIHLDEDTTFSEAVTSSSGGRKFRESVWQRLPESQRAQFFNPDGTLTEGGVELVRNMLLTRVLPIETVERLGADKKALKRTLEGAIPQLLKLTRDYATGDVTPQLNEALEFIVRNPDVRNRGQADDVLAQGSLFGGRVETLSPGGRMMLDFLLKDGQRPKVFRRKLATFLRDLSQGTGLFADELPPIPVMAAETLGVPQRAGAVFGQKHPATAPSQLEIQASAPASGRQQGLDSPDAGDDTFQVVKERNKVRREDIARAFPGTNIVETPDGLGWKVEFEDGEYINVRIDPKIELSYAAYRRSGYTDKVSFEDFKKLRAHGATKLTLSDGTELDGIALVRLAAGLATDKTVRHEAIHVAKKLGKFQETEWKALVEKYSDPTRPANVQEEDIARARDLWQPHSGFLTQLRVWFRRLLDNLGLRPIDAKTVEVLLESPDFWRRPTRPMRRGREQFSVEEEGGIPPEKFPWSHARDQAWKAINIQTKEVAEWLVEDSRKARKSGLKPEAWLKKVLAMDHTKQFGPAKPEIPGVQEEVWEIQDTLNREKPGRQWRAEMDGTFHLNELVRRIVQRWDYPVYKKNGRYPSQVEFAEAWNSMKEAIADFAASVPFTTRESAKSGETVDPADPLRDAFPGGKHYDDIVIPLRRMFRIHDAMFGAAFGEQDRRHFQNILEILVDRDSYALQDARIAEWLENIEGQEELRDKALRYVQVIPSDPDYMQGRKIINGNPVKDQWFVHTSEDAKEHIGNIYETSEGFFNEINGKLSGPFRGRENPHLPGMMMSWSDAFGEAYDDLRDKTTKIIQESAPPLETFGDLFDEGPMFSVGPSEPDDLDSEWRRQADWLKKKWKNDSPEFEQWMQKDIAKAKKKGWTPLGWALEASMEIKVGAGNFGEQAKMVRQVRDEAIQLLDDLRRVKIYEEAQREAPVEPNEMFRLKMNLGVLLEKWQKSVAKPNGKFPSGSEYSAAWEAFQQAAADVVASIPFQMVQTKDGGFVDPIDHTRTVLAGGKKYDDILIPLRRLHRIHSAMFGDRSDKEFHRLVEILTSESGFNLPHQQMEDWLKRYDAPVELTPRVNINAVGSDAPAWQKSSFTEIKGKPILEQFYAWQDDDLSQVTGHMFRTADGFYTDIDGELAGPFAENNQAIIDLERRMGNISMGDPLPPATMDDLFGEGEVFSVEPDESKVPIFPEIQPGQKATTVQPRTGRRQAAAPFASQPPETREGRALFKRLQKDAASKKSKQVGPRSIVEYLNRLVRTRLFVGRTQTTKKHPAHFKRTEHIVRSRAGDWQVNLHEGGHALSAYITSKKPRWYQQMSGQLVALTQMEGSMASAKSAEEGMAELVRRYIVDYGSLPQELVLQFEAVLDGLAPEILGGLRDAHRAYQFQRSRPILEQMESIQNDKPPKPTQPEAVRNVVYDLLFHVIGGGPVLHRIRRRAVSKLAGHNAVIKYDPTGLIGLARETVDGVYRSQQKLARSFLEQVEDTEADFESAYQSVLHVPQEVQRALYGVRKGREGVRVRATGEGFSALDDEALEYLKEAGFTLPSEDVRHGNWIYLSDKSLSAIKHAVGLKDWSAFQMYGQYRAALERHRKAGHDYPGRLDGLTPAKLQTWLQEQEQRHPEWDGHFREINRYMDQLLLVSVLSGETDVVKAVDIKQAWEDYWPLPRQVEGHGPSRRSGAGVEPTAGIRRAFGSPLPFRSLDEAIEIRTKMAFEAYYNNRMMLAVRKFGEKLDKLPGAPFDARKETLRLMVPLRLEVRKVATLTPQEEARIIAEHMNQMLADSHGVPVSALDPEERIQPEDVVISHPGRPLWRMRKPRAVHVVAPFMNGQRQYFQVTDPLLFDLFAQGKDPNAYLGWIMRFVGNPLRPWRRAITQNLGFAASNFLSRDPSTAGFMGRNAESLIPYFHAGMGLINRLKGTNLDAVSESELLSKALDHTTRDAHRSLVGSFFDMLGEGVLIPGYFEMGLSDRIAEAPGQVMSALMKPLDVANWLTGGRALSQLGEQLPREGAYLEALRNGYSEERAQVEYDQITGNFGQKSGNPAVASFVRTAGFLNPALQILWGQTQRITDPDPQVRAFYLGAKLPAIAVWGGIAAALNFLMIHWMYDDDEREEILEWMRERRDEDRLSTMAVGGKIRLPFDYGIVGSMASFGWNSVEEMLLADKIDRKKKAEELLGRARDLPTPTDALHPFFKTGAEVWLNHSFFFDDEIVPAWMEAAYPYNPELQTYPDTAELYKQIGSGLKVSPIKVEYAVRQLFTRQLHDVIGLLDKHQQGRKIEPRDFPVASRLLQEEPRGFRSQSVLSLADINRHWEVLDGRLEELADQPGNQQLVYELKAQRAELAEAHDMWLDIEDVWQKVKDERDQPNPDREKMKELEREMTRKARRFLKWQKEGGAQPIPERREADVYRRSRVLSRERPKFNGRLRDREAVEQKRVEWQQDIDEALRWLRDRQIAPENVIEAFRNLYEGSKARSEYGQNMMRLRRQLRNLTP